MRTTLTLDEDVANDIKMLIRERSSGLKETINEVLRRGLRATAAIEAYESPLFSSGVRPGVDLDKALSIAAGLEDDETVRKFEMGK
jgi:hypothetical protein